MFSAHKELAQKAKQSILPDQIKALRVSALGM